MKFLARAFKRFGSADKASTQAGSSFLGDETFEIEFTPVSLEGSRYFAPKYALHRPAVKKMLNGKTYEPDTHRFVREFCSSFEGSMVHAGTFFGDMLPSFSRSVSGTVYAFEPVFENYILAKLCVDANDLANVVLMNSALSESLGNLYMDTQDIHGRHAGGGSAVSDRGKICVATDIDRLDIQDLILIELDVEGHELMALKGAHKTIRKNRPTIAIEDNNDNCADFLHSLNYEKMGKIPGLNLWCAAENEAHKEKVASFLK